MTIRFFATSPKGLELLLVEELRSLGAENPAEKLAGVEFYGSLETAYKACLWSRLANRILMPLIQIPASTPEELYAGVQTISWDEHLNPESTLSVNFISSQSQITHTLYGAQKVKDAIVDQLREKYGVRPSVAREQPDVSIHVYVNRDKANISIDLSGESLHKRSYRLAGGYAPLKENLAAAILLRAGWPAVAEQGGSLLDPMCGSGTLLIEGAMMAGDIAPGLFRSYFGFLGWKKHNDSLWQNLLVEAKERAENGKNSIPTIVGYDENPEAIKIAFENIERAGLLGKVHVEKCELSFLQPRLTLKPGLVVVNPPYGERLGEEEDLEPLYGLLGDKLKEYAGWQGAVFTGNPELGKKMGIRAKHYYALFNGPIACKLLLFDLSVTYFIDRSPGAENERRIKHAQRALNEDKSEGLQMFLNRLRKNFKLLSKQARRKGETSYRVYDADLPEYAFVIDIKEDEVLVKEYQAPRGVDDQKVLRRRNEMLAALPAELNIDPQKISFEIIARRK